MANHFHIDINNYNYNLEEWRIAKYPLQVRDSSKLLVRNSDGRISETIFSKIPDFLPVNSLLVYNNTKVIHARLMFRKKTGAKIEVFCLNPVSPADYQQSLSQTNKCKWECLVGNLKKWKDEILEMEIKTSTGPVIIRAKNVTIKKSAKQIVEFFWDGSSTFADVLSHAGKIPIPPYLNRESEDIDTERYQTIYSNYSGSVAAPTAGLHFSKQVFQALSNKGISEEKVTLHVGAGTFQPVKAENAREHQMHGEQILIKRKLLENLIAHKGKIIATGTTTMRTLESIYWLGVKLIDGSDINLLRQWDWEALRKDIPFEESLGSLLRFMEKENKDEIGSKTEIMIVPGYQFKTADALITNFHQPKSTLLLLIAAFIGEDWKTVYNYALSHNFRFLSYGDSSLLYR